MTKSEWLTWKVAKRNKDFCNLGCVLLLTHHSLLESYFCSTQFLNLPVCKMEESSLHIELKLWHFRCQSFGWCSKEVERLGLEMDLEISFLPSNFKSGLCSPHKCWFVWFWFGFVLFSYKKLCIIPVAGIISNLQEDKRGDRKEEFFWSDDHMH